MKYHCNLCHRDFTTLDHSADRDAFVHFEVDKMICPNCGARNNTLKLKPLQKTRGRYQPKRKSRTDEDYTMPAIELSEECRKRLCGSISTKLTVVCDGCPSAFNCLTGNVDDGSIATKESKTVLMGKGTLLPENKEIQIAEAKEKVAENKKKEEASQLSSLKDKLSRLGFSYESKDGQTRVRFGGTIWKLTDDDVEAIIANAWNTPKTIIIRNTFINRRILPQLAVDLLKGIRAGA